MIIRSRRRVNIKNSRPILALLVVGLLSLVGASVSSGAEAKSVKIAISAPLSGAGAFAAPIGLGAKAHFEYINDRGGVNGYKFDLSMLDNQISATGGALTAKQALASNPFAMIVGGSAPYGGAASVIREDAPSLPVWGVANAAVIAAGKLQNGYGLQANYTRECYLFAKYTKQTLKQNNIAILWQTDAVGADTGKNCPNFASKRAGIAKVASIPVAFNTTDFGPIAAQLKNTGTKAVVAVVSQPILAGVQKAAQAVGFKPQWMAFNGAADGAYVKIAGGLAEGLIGSNVLEPLTAETPSVRLFSTEVRKRAGESSLIGIGESGWTVAAIIVRGVRDATAGGKTLTQAGFLTAINKLNKQHIGVAPSVSYNTRDHTTVAQSVYLYKVVNGKFVPFAKNIPLPTG